MRIKDWAANERPREKLLKNGASHLTDAELLAVIVGSSGVSGMNCVDWSRMVLSKTGSIKCLLDMPACQLNDVPGIGPARIAQLHALREMMTRCAREKIPPRIAMRDPEALAEYLRHALGSREREVFRVLFLNKKLEILEERNLFEGTIDETPVYPREIVVQALACRASAVILCHNHPSGKLHPSPEDLRVTDKIRQACRLVGIKLLDHVIVGRDGYFSFCGEGLIAEDKD